MSNKSSVKGTYTIEASEDRISDIRKSLEEYFCDAKFNSNGRFTIDSCSWSMETDASRMHFDEVFRDEESAEFSYFEAEIGTDMFQECYLCIEKDGIEMFDVPMSYTFKEALLNADFDFYHDQILDAVPYLLSDRITYFMKESSEEYGIQINTDVWVEYCEQNSVSEVRFNDKTYRVETDTLTDAIDDDSVAQSICRHILETCA